MDVSFQSDKLKRECENIRLASRKWGFDNAKAIAQRLIDIMSFENLEMLEKSKRGRCHPLARDRKGQFALKLKQGWRLIFTPDHDQWESTAQITKVKIIEVRDYHD